MSSMGDEDVDRYVASSTEEEVDSDVSSWHEEEVDRDVSSSDKEEVNSDVSSSDEEEVDRYVLYWEFFFRVDGTLVLIFSSGGHTLEIQSA